MPPRGTNAFPDPEPTPTGVDGVTPPGDPPPGPPTAPPPPATPPHPPQGPNPTGNTTQTVTVTCPDGLPFTVMVPPGLVQGFNQAEANQIATSYINQHILSLRFCLSDFSGSFCVGAGISATISVSGGTGPFTFSASALPAGYTITQTGPRSVTFSGTANTAGNFSFTLRATDPLGDFMEKTFSFTVVGFAPGTLPDGMPFAPYSAQIPTDPGSVIVFFGIRFGSLPTGLSMDVHSGVISGTPTVPGTYPFTAIIFSADGGSCLRDFSIHIFPFIIWTTGHTFNSGTPAFTVGAIGGSGNFSSTCHGGVQDEGVFLTLDTHLFNDLPTARTINIQFSIGYSLTTQAGAPLQSTAQWEVDELITAQQIDSRFAADGSVQSGTATPVWQWPIGGNSSVHVQLQVYIAAAANAQLSLTSLASVSGSFVISLI